MQAKNHSGHDTHESSSTESGDVPTVDDLDVGDKIQWMYSLYEVTAIGTDLCGVPGRHVELRIVDSDSDRASMMEEHRIHERLINRWLDLERSTFYVVPSDREVID